MGTCATALSLAGFAATQTPSAPLFSGKTSRPPLSQQVPTAPLQKGVLSVASPIVIRSADGAPAAATFRVRYSGPLGAHLEVRGSGAVQAVGTAAANSATSFDATVHSTASTVAGPHDGIVQLRMCFDQACNKVVRGTEISVPAKVLVDWVAVDDWGTFQRDSGHTGYVPVTLQPARFALKWSWQRSAGTGTRINSVATEAGRVFVSDDDYFGTPLLRALDEANGSLLWEQAFPEAPALNPPAAVDGRVYITTSGHEKTALWAFASTDGTPLMQSGFPSQWPHYLAPTVKNNRAYTNGGYYGGGVYAFDADLGDPLWAKEAGDDDMATPAVDDEYAYYYSGTALYQYAADTGETTAIVPDPYFPAQGYSYHAAPVLGSPDHVIAFSGGAFSGMASASTEQYESRWLVDFAPATESVRWRTARAYLTQPAVAHGVVYAASNNPKSFDALDEATGTRLWSWVPGTADTAFHRNIVVTDNLAFVSTDVAVYAIDLASHKAVWSYPVPGMLAMSGRGTLYIVEGARSTTGRLIAIDLRRPQ
jgi:outer membrane protein assembly factor BamB